MRRIKKSIFALDLNSYSNGENFQPPSWHRALFCFDLEFLIFSKMQKEKVHYKYLINQQFQFTQVSQRELHFFLFNKNLKIGKKNLPQLQNEGRIRRKWSSKAHFMMMMMRRQKRRNYCGLIFQTWISE